MLKTAKLGSALVIAASLTLPWSSCTVNGSTSKQGIGGFGIAGIPLWVLAVLPIALAVLEFVMKGAVPVFALAAELLLVAFLGLVTALGFAMLFGVSFGALQPLSGPYLFVAGVVAYCGMTAAQVISRLMRTAPHNSRNGTPSPRFT